MTKSESVCLAERDQKCPCHVPCPLISTLERIGGKWKIAIICSLNQDGPLRYNELKRRVVGITNTMLSSSLKELEASELITRTQYMEMPVRVEYAVTEKCSGLMPILHQLAQWGMSVNE